jgi:hypothetical protein
VNTRLIMVASSLFLGAAGIAASFAPAELLGALGAPRVDPMPVLVQLLGALYLGFAITNWTAKDSMIGGIFARPLSLGNFLHFAVGALALVKYAGARGAHGPMLLVLVGYGLLACAFGYLVFGRGMACRG